jgi:hypothetical protein
MILSMNDFQLDSNFIERYTKDINTPHRNITVIREKKLETTNNDSLFWIVYNKLYDNYVKNKYIEEHKLKYEWIELVKTHTILHKKYSKIFAYLSSDKMNIAAFDVICQLFGIYCIIIVDNTYIEINKMNIDPFFITYLHEKCEFKKLDRVVETESYYKIERYDKLIYAISSYRVKQLREYCNKLKLDVCDKDKKIDIYEKFKNRIKLIYLNITL